MDRAGMDCDRRRLLRLAGEAFALSLASAASPLTAPLSAAPRPRPAALLLPVSGDRAALGARMARAAALVQAVATEDTARAGPAVAATRALRRRPPVLLGPLLAAEVPTVVAAAAGRVPVIAFSNDETLAGSGAFLIGLTAAQVVGALLRYARGRGVRGIAIPVPAAGWAAQVAAAAARLAPPCGLTVMDTANADAILLADPATRPAGDAQPLLALPALPATPVLPGAWAAAPDPQGYDAVATRIAAAGGGDDPGLLALLAYDAAGIAARIGTGGRPALLTPDGFAGTTGRLRFRPDGTAARALAILAARDGGWEVVAQDPGA